MLDAKEERKFEELRKITRLLHIPMPEVFWKLEVFDKHGNLLQTHLQRSHSWTRNAYNVMFGQMASVLQRDSTFGAGLLSMKKTDGSVKYSTTMGTCLTPTKNWDIVDASSARLTPAADVDKGILVGSGVNAESFEDYVLQTPIAEGTGAGQLNAIASELHDISYAGLVLSDEQVRYFNNNSGGDVLINEVAIVDGLYNNASYHDVLMVRDKLGATVTVPDTGQVKVTYTIELTYPS